MANRPRGTGSVFQDRPTTPWRIQYSDHGKVFRESSGSLDRKVADELLKDRLAAIRSRVFVAPSKVYVEQLIKLVEADYRNRGRKSGDKVESRWRLHLAEFFTRRRASDITTDLIQRYIDERRDNGAEPATVNRELALLRRAFSLGHRRTPPLVQTIPYFPRLKEAEPRQGFLEPTQRDRLAEECGRIGLWMRSIFECAVSYGFRLHELTGRRGLRVSQVDFLANTIMLHASQTKNSTSRRVVMTAVVRELLMQCVVGKSPQEYVFTRGDGQPVIGFRKIWRRCCARAGCADLIFHDLRRSAIRSLVRSGVSEGVAMKISGHKTASVFKRYDITSGDDLVDASRKLEVARAREQAQGTQVEEAATVDTNRTGVRVV